MNPRLLELFARHVAASITPAHATPVQVSAFRLASIIEAAARIGSEIERERSERALKGLADHAESVRAAFMRGE